MIVSEKATKSVLFSLLLYLNHVHAAWYYDQTSCGKYASQLAKAVPAAIDLAQTAYDAIGNAPGNGAPTGTLWQFPDTETRDLTGRIFGDFQGLTDASKFHLVKNNLNYILQNYNTQGLNNGVAPANSRAALTGGDIVFYCDTERLKKNADGEYENTNTAQIVEEAYTAKDFKDCNTFLKTAGITDVPLYLSNAPVAVQLCSWYMNRIASSWKKNEVIGDYIPYIYDSNTKLKEWLFSRRPSWTEVDMYSLLDHTILHELTHTIPISQNTNAQVAHRATDDVVGYNWKKVYGGRSNALAKLNADSYSFFGLGAKFLKDAGGRINKDGKVERIPNYVWPGATPANPENVDRGWTLTNTKRDISGHANWEDIQPQQFSTVIRKRRDQSNKPWYPIYPRQIQSFPVSGPTGGGVGTGSIGTPSRTVVSRLSNTFGPSTNISASALPSNSDSSTAVDTRSVPSLDSPSTSSVDLSTVTTGNSIGDTPTISSGLMNSSIQVNSTITQTGSILVPITTPLSNSDTATTPSGSNSDETTSTDTGGSPSPTSILPSVTSTTSSSLDLAALLSSFWAQTPTTAPTASWLFCDALDNCPIGTLSLESLVTHTDIYIPPIEDGIFPTIKVKHPKHEDDDGVPEVPFVKIDLPKDKCDPLPKPKAHGLLGAVVNVASKALDTVLDAACHLEVPVIKGKLPKWLKFPSFPPMDGFPPLGDPPGETQEPDPTQDPTASSSSSSSSSSCSASAIPACTTTFFMDGSSTQSFTTSCTTISACSQTAENTATAVTCSATAVPQCVGTNIVSGTITQSYTTSCSTIKACSGTGTTSVTDVTQAPAGTHWPHPLPEPNWVEEVGCALSVLESDTNDFDAAMDACFSITGSPATTDTASLTSAPTETSFSNSNSSMTTPISDTGSIIVPTNATSLDSSTLPPSPGPTSQTMTDVRSINSTSSMSATDTSKSSPPSTTIAGTSAECLSIQGGQGRCITPNPTITPVPPPPPPRENCLNREWAAPATMETTDGSTNARDAIEQFCRNHNSTTIQKGSDSDPTYDRWDVSSFGVTKRGSFWIRASAAPFDQCGQGQITYEDCKWTLEEGLGDCTDSDSGLTYGFVGEGNECIEYSLDVSDSVHEGDPPWNQHVVSYPPNEHEMIIDNPDRGPWPAEIGCGGNGPGYTSDDVEGIIHGLCNLGSGKPFPGIEHGYWVNSGTDEKILGHIWMKAGFANDNWQDPGWCSGHQDAVDTDDCTYAVRKMTSQCGGGFHSANWYYRCSTYLICIATNFNDAKKCITYV